MININTILSTFDEKGTLLKWLKTTNDALKNDSLKSVEAVQPTATTLQLKFIFADDSSLLSPSITLPKGEDGKDATSEFLWNFSLDNINYQIKGHVVSINNDLILKQNELSAEVKMNYIYNFFLNNMISSLSLEFNNKWHKIIEITFTDQTDYTFYYLENGVIKSELIDASIIL